MVLAVIHRGLDVHDGEAQIASVGHGVADAGFHCGDVRPGNRPPGDGVHELEAAAPGHWLDAHVGHAELTVAAGLLLVLALGIAIAGDGLAIGHPQILGLHLDAHAIEAGDSQAQMSFAQSPQQGLAGLFAALQAQ